MGAAALKKFDSQESDYYRRGIVFLIMHGLHDGKLCVCPLVCYKEIQKKLGFFLKDIHIEWSLDILDLFSAQNYQIVR